MKKQWILGFCITSLLALETQAQRILEVDASETVAKIQPTMYGIFFEDINFAADGGLYAEMVKNRSFEFTLPMMGWEEPNSDRHSLNTQSGKATVIKSAAGPNQHHLQLAINNAQGYSLLNNGFRGMGVMKGASYRISFKAKSGSNSPKAVHFSLVGPDGNQLAKTTVSLKPGDWTSYEQVFTAEATEAKAKLKITFEGNGKLDMDMISLFPTDTWKGRKNGLRKDLVQLLYDLNPGFLRFPGGCIVEGRTLDRRYQWKKTVGPVDQREYLVNRWNTEFGHRPTPDYYQSFGLGFFEYFQLAEDLGAEPLPILSCGMACQFNTGELVPMEELDPYIQDALDLIEFANGGTETKWGKLRADMGHPQPFNMKYIGVGNEQWGPDYIERYIAFEKAIRAKYPNIIIVSGSGPFPDGEHFEYGMRELKKLNAEIIDEHYYRNPSWFLENATRYDSYDRKGPKIFAGEYAAQSVAIASPDNKNNWECALSEAAFMTGLERNAEVVTMTSYAPLFAHAEGWQWTPDLIWFNNLESYGTANYYVQKLYSTNAGTDLLSISEDGEALTGQGMLYASAVKDSERNEIIVKVVNASDQAQKLSLKLKGAQWGKKASAQKLTAADPATVNSFEKPLNISPSNLELKLGEELTTELEPKSFYVIHIPLRK